MFLIIVVIKWLMLHLYVMYQILIGCKVATMPIVNWMEDGQGELIATDCKLQELIAKIRKESFHIC